MSMTAAAPRIVSNGFEIPPEHTGALRDSRDARHDVAELRRRMDSDGYLFLPGELHREEVIAARREMMNRLFAQGLLDPTRDPMDGVTAPNKSTRFMPDLALDNAPLKKVVYDGPMMAFFNDFLGAPVRHYDFTWVRAISRGGGTRSHIDVVYMGRGTTNLYTAWTPLADISIDLGGLMILEGSHRNERMRNTYGKMDVDTYCENRPGQKDAWAKGTGGMLNKDPNQILRSVGGDNARWLTGEYRMGDVLIFTVFTVHASLDNQTDRTRLSSDTRYQLASEPADERWVGENPVAHGKAGKRGRIC